MSKRKIIKIDEDKCNGCGQCIPNCPEGALQIIDNKARLISDLFCDGLGACIGHCPQGAITIEERDAEEYDERKAMGNIIKQGKNVIIAHLEHLKEHKQDKFLKQALDFLKDKAIKVPFDEVGPGQNGGNIHGPSGCPGSKIMDFRKKESTRKGGQVLGQQSQLRQWPVQIRLVPGYAPYLDGADLLVAADCVPFAYADFHQDLLKSKILLVGCPKLDDIEAYRQKFIQIIKSNNIKSVTYAHMEVPCCFGLVSVIREAIAAAGKNLTFKEAVISISGERVR